MDEGIKIYGLTTVALTIADGLDAEHVRLLSTYFYVISAVLSSISASRAIAESEVPKNH